MKRAVLVALVLAAVAAVALASTAGAHRRTFVFHRNYTGHAGCQNPIPPDTGSPCALHTNVIKIGVWANAYHEVAANGPSGGACKANANKWCWIFLPYDQTVHPTVITGSQKITSLDGEDYQ